MRQKILAATAALALLSLAAVGAFASQDALQEDTQETPEATATAAPEATETAVVEAIETPEPDVEADEIEESDEGESDKRDITGIPDDHPVFEPDDDGDCEKHESDIKTTPSGNEVTVPCHAADDEEDDAEASDIEAHDEADVEDDETDSDTEDEQEEEEEEAADGE